MVSQIGKSSVGGPGLQLRPRGSGEAEAWPSLNAAVSSPPEIPRRRRHSDRAGPVPERPDTRTGPPSRRPVCGPAAAPAAPSPRRGDIGLVDGDRGHSIMRLAPKTCRDQGNARRFLILILVDGCCDRFFESLPPAFRRAPGQDDPGVRIDLDKVAPVVRRGPVHARGVTGKQRVQSGAATSPARATAASDRRCHDFGHVMTRPKPRNVRLARRVRSGAAEASSNHLDRNLCP